MGRLGAGRNGLEMGGDGGDLVIDAHADLALGRDALDSETKEARRRQQIATGLSGPSVELG